MTGESGIIALCPCHDVTFIFAKYEYKTLKVSSLGHLTMVTLATWCFSLPLMWPPYFSWVDFDYGDIDVTSIFFFSWFRQWWHCTGSMVALMWPGDALRPDHLFKQSHAGACILQYHVSLWYLGAEMIITGAQFVQKRNGFCVFQFLVCLLVGSI